jgi:hypothetical protein
MAFKGDRGWPGRLIPFPRRLKGPSAPGVSLTLVQITLQRRDVSQTRLVNSFTRHGEFEYRLGLATFLALPGMESQRAVGAFERRRIVAQFGENGDKTLFDPALRHPPLDRMNLRLAGKGALYKLKQSRFHIADTIPQNGDSLRKNIPPAASAEVDTGAAVPF